MAIIGMFFQDGLTGSAWGDWALYTDSPLRAFENELGVQAPVGFWDPAGLSADGSVENFARRRATELKHGRISMLATMGYITPELTGKFPGYLSPSAGLKFADVPNGLAAISKVPAAGWAQIAAYAAYCELSQDQSPGTPAAAGDFGFKVLTSSDPAEKQKKLAAEIANGRLAMMAIIGMFFQDGLTGAAWGDWALYTASPLRAFESELGVQAPVGFWDPLGLSADGDVDTFKRRRAAELKHGRICMLATLGYIVPEYFKFPGYLSPSLGLKFADIPNGIAAVSKVPIEGWLQIGLFAGHMEGQFFRQDPKRAPGDFEGYGFLGVGRNFIFNFAPATIADPEVRKKKVNAEIANGRLAMVAIMAMLYQNGTVGTTGPEMWLPGSAYDTELGVTMPFKYWDPLGLANAPSDDDDFRRRRMAEIKNGRVAMFACMGYIAPEYFRWPGYLSPSAGIKFSEIPNGVAALSKVPAEGWAQIGVFIGFLELFPLRQEADRMPGDFATCGKLGVPWFFVAGKDGSTCDPVGNQRGLNAEINNGRLAMVAITGMISQNGFFGSTGPEMWLPGSAFENELGVQAPVGFWDPLGLAADGSADDFRRRRETEIKHGRVSMIACIGYITPEYFKFPGALAPHINLKFTDVPNGLAAISKVP